MPKESKHSSDQEPTKRLLVVHGHLPNPVDAALLEMVYGKDIPAKELSPPTEKPEQSEGPSDDQTGQ